MSKQHNYNQVKYNSPGIVLWVDHINTSQLEIMQQKIIRIIRNVPVNSHTPLLFMKNKIIQFKDIYKMEISKNIL